ncbi:hypothetical protein UY3_10357 [Chelonia mydas]|uniref:Uncharacterized protein n=1 Tax=Chelonia mydas TaxID=8469 RepID=M7B3P6_CHEMY|nr:hypothetical protein UY3_10357 [Chelonia mydas]
MGERRPSIPLCEDAKFEKSVIARSEGLPLSEKGDAGGGRRNRKKKKRKRKFHLISLLALVGCDNSLNMDEAYKRDDLPAVVVTKEISQQNMCLERERMMRAEQRAVSKMSLLPSNGGALRGLAWYVEVAVTSAVTLLLV